MILMVMVYYNLQAERDAIIRDCVAGDDLYLRGESAYHHGHLKRVKITGFHSAKSLIKLVIHILECVPSQVAGGAGQSAKPRRRPAKTAR
jgi:hypothetical protein